MDKKKILLDTNFLMIPYTENIEIFQEIERLVLEKYELFTLTGVVEELKRIEKDKRSKGRDKIASRVALQLIEKKNIKVIESHGRVDRFIIDFAQRNKKDVIICTNDKRLRKKLKKLNVSTICMRGRNRLEFAL
ncbi:MAG: nucleotide-binding protein [Deltaproteobacteria bacterium]|nr:MAG: nucleotide-binding protein [Deltaproteobacteria bacterium]